MNPYRNGPIAHYNVLHCQPFWQQPHQRFNRQDHMENKNEEHWCETCDRSFFSKVQLVKHKQQHQKCNIDGCEFIAHPKVITKHIQMQHASGLYKQIAKLKNPEDIQKWRDERKKRYPTKENIEKKAAERKEKVERGERIGLNQLQKNKNDNDVQRKHFSNYQKGKRLNNCKLFGKTNSATLNKPRKSIQIRKNINEVPAADSSRILKPFSGIQDIVMEEDIEVDIKYTNNNFIIEDDDYEKISTAISVNVPDITKPTVCGALSSLMCEYNSSDDELECKNIDDSKKKLEPKEMKKIMPLSPKFETQAKKDNTNREKENSNDDSGPEEAKIIKKQPETVNLIKHTEPNKIKGKYVVNESNVNKTHYKRPKHKIPSTLLQKLLKREMQQERNIVLQCIRHIVKNNYFDKKS